MRITIGHYGDKFYLLSLKLLRSHNSYVTYIDEIRAT